MKIFHSTNTFCLPINYNSIMYKDNTLKTYIKMNICRGELISRRDRELVPTQAVVKKRVCRLYTQLQLYN